MKKIISAITFAILLSSMINVNLFGQLGPIYSAVLIKKGEDPVATKTPVASKATRKIELSNAKAERHLLKNFKTNDAVHWSRNGEVILATIKNDGVTTRVTYSNTGIWFRTIKSYRQSLLKESIKELLQENFKNYEIKAVSEVTEANFHCYFINMEKGKDFKQILVYDRVASVYKQFKLQ